MSKKKRAFITGIFGQDGSYLAEFLYKKGYKVYGLSNIRNNISPDRLNIFDKVIMLEGDLTDIESLRNACNVARPDEVYNLAAISDLETAKKYPEKTMDINFIGVKRLFEIVSSINPSVRFFQALSGRILNNSSWPQNEKTPLIISQNPYDSAKIKVYKEIIIPYRNNNFYICGGFLFNHESPRRDNRFVTRKITQSLIRIKNGLQEVLELGNLDAKRDWGFAGDYIKAMWMMLQQDKPEDYVIATGETHTVREFINEVARAIELPISWEGEGINSVGKNKTGEIIVKCNSLFFKEEIGISVGDISKIQKNLGWRPTTTFQELIMLMVEKDLNDIRK